jgi:hypothetical protein
MTGKTFIISEDLANKILDYLDDKPFKEVFEMVDGLMKLVEVKK